MKRDGTSKKVKHIALIAATSLSLFWLSAYFFIYHKKGHYSYVYLGYKRMYLDLVLLDDKLSKVALSNPAIGKVPIENKHPLDKWVIIPLLGACGIKFGAGESEIRKVWGKPSFSLGDRFSSMVLIYEFREGKITFELEEDKVNSISIEGYALPFKISGKCYMGCSEDVIIKTLGRPETMEKKTYAERAERVVDLVPTPWRFYLTWLILSFWAIFASMNLSAFFPFKGIYRVIAFVVIWGVLELIFMASDALSLKFLTLGNAQHKVYQAWEGFAYIFTNIVFPTVVFTKIPPIFLIALTLYIGYPYPTKKSKILHFFLLVLIGAIAFYLTSKYLFRLTLGIVSQRVIGASSSALIFYPSVVSAFEDGAILSILVYGWLLFFQNLTSSKDSPNRNPDV